jgi:hypothetical protein
MDFFHPAHALTDEHRPLEVVGFKTDFSNGGRKVQQLLKRFKLRATKLFRASGISLLSLHIS